MLGTSHKINHLSRWFYLFICMHVTAWTLAPYFMRFTLPMDAMEGTIWGQHWQWGYDKNPFMNGWLTGLALQMSDHAEWGIYLFSQLSVAICFYAVWQLGKKILPPVYALLAVLLLEGAQYYNLHAIDFNDNTIELSLWALTVLYFYNALQKQKISDWLLTGLFAGLGMMTKYYTAMLLIAMAGFIILNKEARQSWNKPALYYGLTTFIAIIFPHVVWLFQHDFVTVNYALERISKPSTLTHINYSVNFAWEQFAVFIPSLLLALGLMLGQRPARSMRFNVKSFDRQFLLYLGFGPYLLTVVLSALTGIKLRAGWGEPLLSLWGIMVIAWLQPAISTSKFYRFMAVFFGLFALTVSLYVFTLLRGNAVSSANFPGKIIAANLTRSWHETAHAPLFYVAGSRWLAGSVAFYSHDQPNVYIDWDNKLSPWIDEKDLRLKGGIFMWNMSKQNEPPPEIIRQRFNTLGNLKIMHFSWLRNNHEKPIVVGVAFLPPA